MGEYIINVLLEFVPIFVVMTIGYVAALFIKKSNKGLVTKVYLLVSLLVLILVSLGSDNTYKHTTGYNKTLDVKTLEMQQKNVPIVIKDNTKPVISDKERKKSFDEMVKYKEENK